MTRWPDCRHLQAQTRQRIGILDLPFADADSGRRGMDCSLPPMARRFLVSEYQYYDFRALDRALTKNEIAALRSVSTRAAITSRVSRITTNGET